MMRIPALLLLICATPSAVHATGDGRVRRTLRCLPRKIALFFVNPTKTGFEVQLPVLNIGRRCRGEAQYIIRWTPRGEETREERVPWHQQHFSVDGLKPWTTVDIEAHMEYKDDQEGKYEDTPLIKKDTTTLKGTPSPPLNLRVDEIEERAIRITWDAPETPNGPIDGYVRRVCWGEQHCDSRGDRIRGIESDTYNKTAQYLSGLRPLMYYGISLRAFNVVGKRERLYSGQTKLCVRFPPPQAET
ncbi:protein sidekick homolog isoform X2 [Ornithodoros turicata]|uniref:protein sidekick homolog isoform X2 n=1 Tax=Ornithodoros turicata TaxID=34597 RepID=UPI00313951D8